MAQDLAITADRDRTLELATFFTTLKLDDLPENVVRHAKASILNSIGCGLSASSMEPHKYMLAALDIASKQSLGGMFSAATILGRSEHASVEDAAMLNGLAMTARFFDDTHLSTVVHPSGAPLAALLAYAEANHLSGDDVILAFVVGVETMLAIATALSLEPYKRGWHTTGITSTFGATAAIAKIMKLSPIEFAHALGHASSMASGTRGVFGTETLSMHAGRAAQNGLLAAKMAKAGLRSTTHALEKWVKLISHDNGDLAAITALADTNAKDRKWLILENAFKPYPCGIVVHPAIDADLAAHEYFFADPSSPLFGKSPQEAHEHFSSIEARVTPLTVKLCGVRHPTGEVQSIFSTYHGIAIGLLYGKAGIREFGNDVIKEPSIRGLRDLIQLFTDDTLADDQASLTITYNDVAGVATEKRFTVEHATGSLQNPMSEKQLEEKFMDQASIGGIKHEAAQQALKDLWDLEAVEDVGSIMKHLVPGPDPR